MNVNIANNIVLPLFPDNGFVRWKLLLEYLVCQLVARARADTKVFIASIVNATFICYVYCFSLTYLPAEDN